ncbi:ATP-dependent DNA ligase [Marinobacterium zhoushanense]|uniref:ATP-dependent DNA ligase n=1 Tax=Marinobacterium zhoushanense TaxID=1679163 RepID=A0ABQ1KTJ7_9GAMM|nr:DNA ligase [Marinobacterium zhoushanense]GGC10133.1 ATP-dependent DNA ligase [Marinobacterium zhoushanense]
MSSTTTHLSAALALMTTPAFVIAAPVPALMSAQTLLPDQQIESADYLVSEKLDGVRARWNGQQLQTRSGAPISAPDWFIHDLPPIELDGELWLGRSRFAELSALIRRNESTDDQWRQVSFMLFDLPLHPGTFVERHAALLTLFPAVDNRYIRVIEQRRAPSRDKLEQLLVQIQRLGGEGLMLHHSASRYVPNRSDLLLKYKGYQDAEARVVGYTDGKGKYTGMTGALIVENDTGLRFRIGSGLSDAERENPPAIGSTITYRYNGLTSQGKPRFARFMRVRDPEL